MNASKLSFYYRHRDKILEARRLEYAENIVQRRAEAVARTAANRGSVRAKARAYYERNAETIRAQTAAWKRANPLAVATVNQRRRALQRGAGGELTVDQVREITAMQGGRCAHCQAKRKLTIDHIKPLARGGRHHRRNIQMLCRSCNAKKGARDPIEFAQSSGQLL